MRFGTAVLVAAATMPWWGWALAAILFLSAVATLVVGLDNLLS